MTKEEILKRIKYYTEKQSLTRYALAKRSGVSNSTLNNIFNRGTAPDIVTLQKIVYNGFGITMGEFFGEKEESFVMSKDKDAEEIYYKYLSLNKDNKKVISKIIKALQ